MKRGVDIAVGATTLLAALSIHAPPASAKSAFVPGEVIVRFDAGISGDEQAQIRRRNGTRLERVLRVPRTQLLALEPGVAVRDAVRRLERQPGVRYAEPNAVYRVAGMPSDPLFGDLWGLHNAGGVVNGIGGTADADIDAPEAWDLSTGNRSVRVAVVDSGVLYDDADLAPNVYTHAQTGAHGWDWIGDDADPRDEFGHGTHVAGTIGARGNDSHGLTGVNWHVTLLPLRVLGRDGSGDAADVADAFAYAAQQGAKVVNASFGGGWSQAVADAVAAAPTTMFVAAAGNSSEDVDGYANETYPCSLPHQNVICVAATDGRDRLAWFSSWGDTSVDLAAPGVDVLSTYPRVDTVFFDDFETDVAGRWVNPDLTADAWQRAEESAKSPTHSFADSPGGRHATNRDAVAELARTFDLGGRRCEAEFLLDIDTGWMSSDVLRLEYKTNNWDWSLVSSFAARRRQNVRVPLQNTHVSGYRFRFAYWRTNDGRQGDGVEIDDFAIRCRPDTLTANGTRFSSGTSMAAPHVSGTAALVWGHEPGLTVGQVRQRILASVDRFEWLAGKTATAGRLNAHGALTGRVTPPLPMEGRPLISTVAGSGPTGPGTGTYAGDGGPATSAQLVRPGDVAAAPAGGFVVADPSNHRVRRVTADGRIDTIAGTGSSGFSGDGGPGAQAQLATPTGVAVDPAGGVLIADRGNGRIRRVATDGRIHTVAGGGSTWVEQGGTATQQHVERPGDVDALPDGGFLFTDWHGLWRVSSAGVISRVDRRPAEATQVAATAGGGAIWVESNSIAGVDGEGRPLSLSFSQVDPETGETRPFTFTHAWGIDTTPDGGLLVSDNRTRVWRVDPQGFAHALAGTGTAGFSGDGGRADLARLAHPLGISMTPGGGVLVADSDNRRIRLIDRYKPDAPAPPGNGGSTTGPGDAGPGQGDGGVDAGAQITGAPASAPPSEAPATGSPAAPGGGAAPPGTAQSSPPVRIVARVLRLRRNGTIAPALSCPAAASAPCRGTLTVNLAPGGAPRGARAVTLGRRSFRISPGRRARVRVKLSRTGRRYLSVRGRLRVSLVAAMRGGAVAERVVTVTARATRGP